MSTPYYKNYLNGELETNYTPYHIFGLKSKLYPWVKKNIGKDVGINVHGEKIGTKIVMKVKLTREKKSKEQDLQKKIDEIVNGNTKSILFYYPSQIGKIPIEWIKSVYKYINIHPLLKPYVSNEDVDDGAIYIEAGHIEDYYNFVSSLLVSFENKIVEMYQKGCIILPSENTKINWNLKSENSEKELWFPNWNQKRVTEMSGGVVSFLQNIENNMNYYIPLSVFSNNVIKYYISKNFISDYYFKKDILYIKAVNYDSIVKDLVLLDNSISEAHKNGGKVILFEGPSMMTINVIKQVLEEFDYKNYSIYIENFTYIISVLIPFEINDLQIKKDIYSETLKRMESKISVYKK